MPPELHQAAAPAPAAQPQAPPAALPPGLEARIHDAVQQAAIYPPAARLMHRQGRALVRFAYAGGTAEAISLERSSQSRLLDEAALAAVRRAAYPPAPEAVRRSRLALLVWVDFGTGSN